MVLVGLGGGEFHSLGSVGLEEPFIFIYLLFFLSLEGSSLDQGVRVTCYLSGLLSTPGKRPTLRIREVSASHRLGPTCF